MQKKFLLFNNSLFKFQKNLMEPTMKVSEEKLW
jgi:hypothetical protein